MNTREYWKQIRKSASLLDPDAAAADAAETDPVDRVNIDNSDKEIWLMSIENHNKGSVGGRVFSCKPITAARMLDDATHRIATIPEILAHQRTLEERRLATERDEADRKGTPVNKLLEAMIAGQQGILAAGRGAKPTNNKENQI